MVGRLHQSMKQHEEEKETEGVRAFHRLTDEGERSEANPLHSESSGHKEGGEKPHKRQGEIHDNDEMTIICVTKQKGPQDKTGLRFRVAENDPSAIKIDRVAPDGIFANTELLSGMTLLRVNHIDISGWELAKVIEIIRSTKGELTLEAKGETSNTYKTRNGRKLKQASIERKAMEALTSKPAPIYDESETKKSKDALSLKPAPIYVEPENPLPMKQRAEKELVPSESWRRAKGMVRYDEKRNGTPSAARQGQDNGDNLDDQGEARLTNSMRRLKRLPPIRETESNVIPAEDDDIPIVDDHDAVVGKAILRQEREERIATKVAGLQSDSLRTRKMAWAGRAEVAAAHANPNYYGAKDNRASASISSSTPSGSQPSTPQVTPGAFAVNLREPSEHSFSESDNSPGVMEANVEPMNQISTTLVCNVEAKVIQEGMESLSTRDRFIIGGVLVAIVTTLVLVVVLRKLPTTSGGLIGPDYSRGAFLRSVDLRASIAEYLASNSSESQVAIDRGYPIGTWDVSRIADFSFAFDATKEPLAASFNEDISAWDVSGARYMMRMFLGAKSFNQPLLAWNVSGVIKMQSMFAGAENFNQDLSGWNVSSATSLRRMFKSAKSFNTPLVTWDVRKVIRMDQMFQGSAFNQAIQNWDTRSVTVMSEMFADSAFNQSVALLDISKVQDMTGMFRGASDFNQSACFWTFSLKDIWNSAPQFHDMFQGTSCPKTDDPECSEVIRPNGGRHGDGVCVGRLGPFCHACS